jgi:methylaspartate ammonia-lyase
MLTIYILQLLAVDASLIYNEPGMGVDEGCVIVFNVTRPLIF